MINYEDQNSSEIMLRYDQLWKEDVYDLSSEGAGVCYTYNPPSASEPGAENKFLAYLGNMEYDVQEGYYIHLHEKGQFWPMTDLEMIGQTERLRIDPKNHFKGYFKVKEITFINKKDKPCEEDPNYSFTACLKEFIQTRAGCHLWIWSDGDYGKYPPCRNISDFHKYKEEMGWILPSKWSNLVQKTKCFPKCKIREFELVKTSEQAISWGTSWQAEFQLGAKHSSYQDWSEYAVFQPQDFIASLGGYLGLFLGWSLLSVIQWIQQKVCVVFGNIL